MKPRFAKGLVTAALCLAAQAVHGTQTPFPMLPAGSNVHSLAFRSNTAAFPASIQPNDIDAPVQAAGDARKAFAINVSMPAATNPTLSLPSAYRSVGLGSWTCTSGSATLTLTLPQAVLPAKLADGSISNKLEVNGCGTSGGTLTGAISSITGANPYTFTLSGVTASSTIVAPTVEPFSIYPSTLPGNSQITTGWFQHSTVTQWDYDTGSISVAAASGGTPAIATLTLPNYTFNQNTDLSYRDANGLQQTYVQIDDPTGACTSYSGTIATSPSYAAVTLYPAPSGTQIGSPFCTSTTTNLVVWWGYFLFPPKVASGVSFQGVPWACEIPGVGAAGVPEILTASGYIDPLHAQFAGTSSTEVDQFWGAMQCGTPDDNAISNSLLFGNSYAFGLGYRTLYLKPPGVSSPASFTGSYMMTGSTAVPNLSMDICSDRLQDQIYWPTAYPELRNAHLCATSRGLPPPHVTLDPNRNLRHSQTVIGRPVVLAITSDSLFNNNSNGLGGVGSAAEIIEKNFTLLLGKNVKSYTFSIGGTTANQFDPYGMTTGNGAGIPTTAQIASTFFYTNSSAKWISYPLAKCADIYLMEWQNDVNGFSPHVLKDINGYLAQQSLSTCGFVPDIIWATGPGQSTTGYPVSEQEQNQYMQGLVRSLVMSQDTFPYWASEDSPYHQVGLLDFNSRHLEATMGWSPWNLPMLRANDVLPASALQGSSAKISLPYTWPRAIRAFTLGTGLKTSSSNQTSTQFFNTFLQGGLDVPTGNGLGGDPYNVGISAQTNALQQAFPNNMLQFSRDTTTGNIAVTGYEFFQSETATCSMSGTTLTCTTPIWNEGYTDSTIAIQNAGSQTCPPDIGGSTCLVTNIVPPTTGTINGEVLTTLAAGALSSQSVKIDIYQTYPTPASGATNGTSPNSSTPPAYLTETPAQSVLNNGSDASPSCGLCGFTNGLYMSVTPPMAYVTANNFAGPPILYSGPIVSFGGRYFATIGAGWNGNATPANQTIYPTPGISTEDADDMVWWTPTLPDDYMGWCPPPGYSCAGGGGYTAHESNMLMTDTLAALFGSQNLSTTTPIIMPQSSLVAGLPTCSSTVNKGVVQAVTDATAPTFGVALTGGGTVFTLAVCDGSSWKAH